MLDYELSELPCASQCLHCFTQGLDCEASFAIEVFLGDCVFTMGLMFAKAPTFQPWDIRYGLNFDVLTHGYVLCALVDAGYLVSAHLAIPCQSLTWARWPHLRNAAFPKGLPNLVPKQAALVEAGNQPVEWTCKFCMRLYGRKAYFSVENPELTWLWVLRDVWSLYLRRGVILTEFTFKAFGTPYLKPTLMLHNSPELHRLSMVELPSAEQSWQVP